MLTGRRIRERQAAERAGLPPPPPPRPREIPIEQHEAALRELSNAHAAELAALRTRGQDPESEALRARVAELEQRVVELQQENDDLNAELDELTEEDEPEAAAVTSSASEGPEPAAPPAVDASQSAAQDKKPKKGAKS